MLFQQRDIFSDLFLSTTLPYQKKNLTHPPNT